LFTLFRVDQELLASIDGKVGVKASELPAELVAILEIKSRASGWPEYFDEPRRTVWDEQGMHSTLHAAGYCVSVYQIVDERSEASIGIRICYPKGWGLEVRQTCGIRATVCKEQSQNERSQAHSISITFHG
jgi:hypothetical protein